jgi:16S rRNA processing protein RimM
MDAEDGRRLKVSESRPNRGRHLVRFETVADRTEAETLTGQYLFVSSADVPELPADSFWPHELVGCEVVTEAGRSFGRIVEVIHGEANDVWVARDDGDETLVPALKDVVVSVDAAAGTVVIREVPGLVE